MNRGARRLFIYYRVHAERASETIAAAARLQAELRARHPGLEALLMRRPTDPKVHEPYLTLMETYAMDVAVAPLGVDAAQQADIEATARARLGESIDRHVEVFETCAW